MHRGLTCPYLSFLQISERHPSIPTTKFWGNSASWLMQVAVRLSKQMAGVRTSFDLDRMVANGGYLRIGHTRLIPVSLG